MSTFGYRLIYMLFFIALQKHLMMSCDWSLSLLTCLVYVACHYKPFIINQSVPCTTIIIIIPLLLSCFLSIFHSLLSAELNL